MSSSLLIGIGGVSRSGKTRLAKELQNCFSGKTIAVVNQDEYIHSAFQMHWIEEELDWEDPDSLDFHRMYYEISWLAKNVEVLIVEGLFAFYYSALNNRYDKRIMVEIDYSNFKDRKLKDERWGKVPDWYIRHIWDSFMKFGMPDQKDEVLRVNGLEPYNFKNILDYINH